MTTDQALILGLFAAMFGAFLWGRVRYDVVALGALLAGVLLGLVPSGDAFSGFGSTAVVTVALVLAISAGLTRSGAVALLGARIVGRDTSPALHIARIGGVGAVLSAFMNNVAALALLMPLDVDAARRAGRAAALTLMPLAFATMLGGLVTLIGTPPNILISGFREQATGTPFAMFDFAPVGLAVAIAGLAFVAFGGWRLIPVRQADSAEERGAGREYLAELVSGRKGKDTRPMVQTEEEADRAGVALLYIRRGNRRVAGAALRSTGLEPDDRLIAEGTADALEAFRLVAGLDYARGLRGGGGKPTEAESEGLAVIEAVVRDGGRAVGRSSATLGLEWRQGAVLIGISRRGRRIGRDLRRTRIEAGDLLLLLVPTASGEAVAEWLGCLPLATRGLTVGDPSKAALAVGLFAVGVAVTGFGLLYLPIAFALVVLAYTLLRILPPSELYTAIEWPVIVLLGALIPLGVAVEETGAAALIAGSLIGVGEGLPAWVILTLLMVVTMTLSDVLNNAATAILAAPVALQVAEGLNASPDPFLMAVAIAASCAFLTPIGHQNNTLILGPGGYRFGDYWRMGLPLEILVVSVSVPAILLFWPL